jgi:hypothetical protein
MVLEILSVPPMSSEPERLFSVSGAMVAPKRTRLDASTIGIDFTFMVPSRIDEAEDYGSDRDDVNGRRIRKCLQGGRRWRRRGRGEYHIVIIE